MRPTLLRFVRQRRVAECPARRRPEALERSQPPAGATHARLDPAAALPGDDEVATGADRDRHGERPPAAAGDDAWRREAPTRAPLGKGHGTATAADSLQVGHRDVAAVVGAKLRPVSIPRTDVKRSMVRAAARRPLVEPKATRRARLSP